MKRISFDTARLADEKGYKVGCNQCYICDTQTIGAPYYGDSFKNGDDNGSCIYEAPYQSELQEWLRNNYNCFIVITPEAYTEQINWQVQVLFYDNLSYDCWSNKSSGMYGDNGEFPTYEDALEFGLKLALERL